ncbi:MAG TPA: hypothetical protein VMW49_05055 [Candidatus Dormibacteraeota bacterium]|nr:hypothetical protein [Candidatus Dormibacteraeota bacterium]
MDTPTLRRLRARRAALLGHAQGRTNTGPARVAFASRFEREVDPDGQLDPVERARRADLARRAFYTGLAIKSAETRARKRRGTDR